MEKTISFYIYQDASEHSRASVDIDLSSVSAWVIREVFQGPNFLPSLLATCNEAQIS